jgi:hypothetical protein
VFGTLTYDVNACWESYLTDTSSHEIGGIVVNFSVIATNKGQVKSHTFTITTTTTDWFDSNPWSMSDSWKYTGANEPDAKTARLDGPEVLPGKSRTVKWHTYFLTPFDPHYTISIDERFGQVNWELWTKSKLCF